MPSRRSLLAAGGTATVTALAGCSVGSRSGTPAAFTQRSLRPQNPPAVAQRQAEHLDDPHGHLLLEAAAYDPADGDLVVWTGATVVPGRNVDDYDGDWLQGGIDVTHDWVAPASDERPAAVRTTSNVRPTDGPAPATLETAGEGEVGRWQVRLHENARNSTAVYEFRSTYPAADLGEGEDIAEIGVEASYETGGLLGESATVSRSLTLTYGDSE